MLLGVVLMLAMLVMVVVVVDVVRTRTSSRCGGRTEHLFQRIREHRTKCFWPKNSLAVADRH